MQIKKNPWTFITPCSDFVSCCRLFLSPALGKQTRRTDEIGVYAPNFIYHVLRTPCRKSSGHPKIINVFLARLLMLNPRPKR